VDAVLAPDFDNLAPVLPSRWLSGKDPPRLLARSRPNRVRTMDCRPLRAIRTKDEAKLEFCSSSCWASLVRPRQPGIQRGLAGTPMFPKHRVNQGRGTISRNSTTHDQCECHRQALDAMQLLSRTHRLVGRVRGGRLLGQSESAKAGG
jgi:hypothetical protein